MEIERKFLVTELPEDLARYPHHEIEQAYLQESPVLRIRKKDTNYIFTYKSRGLMMRHEYEFPITRDVYIHLKEKADGKIISKTRYLIPYLNYTIELDVFHEYMAPLVMAEVEFQTEEDANSFIAPRWFGEDVTYNKKYHNVNMALHQ
jgi:CYTH domain-containing protein